MTAILTYIPGQEALKSLNVLTVSIILTIVAAFVISFIANRIITRRVRKRTQQSREIRGIMQHALEIGQINVLRFLTGSWTIVNTHGNLIDGEITFEDFFGRLHADDRANFNAFLQKLSSRGAEAEECNCRLKLSGDSTDDGYHYMHCHAIAEANTLPVVIICTMTDETATVTEQQEEEELAEKYHIIFDQSFVGLAFHDKEGMLLAANREIRAIFHSQGEHDPYYNATSLFDMALYRDLIDRHHVEPLYFCTRCVIPERAVNAYLTIRIHPVLDSIGNLLYISVAVRDTSEERNLYLQRKQNDREMRQANEAIQQYENELQYLMDNCDMRVWRTSFKERQIYFYKGLSDYEKKLTFEEFQSYFVDPDDTFVQHFNSPETSFSKPLSALCHMRSVFHSPDMVQWNMIDSIPVYDKKKELEGSFGTIRNMTALMQAQEHLKEETRRANDSGRQKSLFMANMTHEIRTPLNSIVGFSDLLPVIDSPADKREMVQVIMNNCDMLLRLINDILEISSMNSKTINLEPTDIDFAQAFNAICKSEEERMQNPAVAFVCDNPYDTCPARIDIQRVNQIVTNFITNSVKYTQQGHIKLGYRKETRSTADGEREGVYVYCEDTGIGIPKEKQGSVFDRFVKLNDFVQGTGLGLSICKAITNRADGQIGVESEGGGQGSTFWFWMPFDTK